VCTECECECDADLDGESDEQYEMAQSRSSMTPGDTAAVRFLVTAESIVQHDVIMRNNQNSTTDQWHCHSGPPPHSADGPD